MRAISWSFTIKNLCLFIFLMVIGNNWALGLSPLKPQSGTTVRPENRIISLRSSQQVGKARFVIETEKASDYQVYTVANHLYIELFDIKETAITPGNIRNRQFVNKWSASFPAIGLFRWDITTAYPIPVEQCKIERLINPERLVVDIYTKWVEDEHYNLTPGITWHRRQYFGQGFPYLLWNQISFDPKDEHIKLDLALGQDSPSKCESVSSLVHRKKAIVGINGGYFDMVNGGALGLVVRQGKIISPDVKRRPPRSIFALTNDKKATFARAKVVNSKVLTLDNREWKDLDIALGGGPRLISNRQIKINAKEEGLGPGGNDITRSCGRTAIGTDERGHISLTTASGYSDSHSEGATLEEMAYLLQRSGAVNAVNLDGGGSVDMAIQGNLVAHGPNAGKYERPVANALLVFDDRPINTPATIAIQAEKSEAKADGQSKLSIAVLVCNESGNPVEDGTPVFFSAQGLENSRALTVNGQAYATLTIPRLEGELQFTAKSGLVSSTFSIPLQKGNPDRLLARWNRTIKDMPPISSTQSPKAPTPPIQNYMEDIPPTPSIYFDFGAGTELDEEQKEDNNAIESALRGEIIDNQTPAQNATIATVNDPIKMQIINFRARLIDEWYNGLANQTVELWNGDVMVGSYTTNGIGEVKGIVQLPLNEQDLEIRCAGVETIKMVF